jgi:putative ubiquitin-RnfH superfamily antitoxin RatB of RatAB toxin-antitoxin module
MDSIFSGYIEITICYSSFSDAHKLSTRVPANSNIRQAIQYTLHEKAFYSQISHFDIEKIKLGVFGKLKDLNYILNQGDRIEIYRPLIANPMDARRRRVIKATKINVKSGK